MDSKFKNKFTLCLLVFLVEFHAVFCDGIRWTTFYYNNNINYGECIKNATAFEAEAQDHVECLKMCRDSSVCESFSYNSDNLRCIGCRYKHDDAPAPLENVENQSRPIQFSKSDKPHSSDCMEILRNRPNAKSGQYEIRLWKSKKTVTVYCDMETESGGWTVFQNRFDGTIDFYRNFAEYENGFGVTEGEFWLGLKYVQEIADQSSTEMRIDVSVYPDDSNEGDSGFETYQGFLLTGPDYTLNLDKNRYSRRHSVSTKDSVYRDYWIRNTLYDNDGLDFTTFDHDRDTNPKNCGELAQGAWWFSRLCGKHNLNGPYKETEESNVITHGGLGLTNPLKTSRMMLRRV